MKIKDANLINNVTGTEKVPVSAGTGAPATVSLDQIKDFATNDLVKKSDLPKPIVSVTYAELVSLRDNGKLIAGTQYRITDYVTEAYQNNEDGCAISAKHPFDLIVTADSNNALNEIAKAIQHDGDEYFANSDLNAWKIWYSLDNDRSKYGWACDGSHIQFERVYIKHEWLDYTDDVDGLSHKGFRYDFIENNINKYMYILLTDYYKGHGSTITLHGNWTEDDAEREMVFDNYKYENTNVTIGKGVIYRMIDEFGNDLPYDFKNIMFNRYSLNVGDEMNYGEENWVTTAKSNLPINSIRPEIYFSAIYEGGYKNILDYSNNETVKYLKYNVAIDPKPMYTFTYVDSDIVDYNSVIEDASLKGFCRFNEMGPRFSDDKLQLNNNVFFIHKIIGDDAIEPKHYYCYSNKLGDNCHRNTFGAYCFSIILGNSCRDNIFGNQSYSMELGNYCRFNYFGTECNSNILGNYANSNIFGNKTYSNKFGSFAKFNTTGKYCRYNTFGNAHTYNVVTDYFTGNTFGNYCSNNFFGKSFRYNTFGNSCSNIKILSDTNYSRYFQNNRFNDGVKNVFIRGNSKGSGTNFVQNYVLSQGLDCGGEQINFNRNLSNETFVSKNSNGQIKSFCLADIFM